MPDATLSNWLSAHAIPGDDLSDILDEYGMMELALWLEEVCHVSPTDAEMSRWQSVGDVELWMANVEVRAA